MGWPEEQEAFAVDRQGLNRGGECGYRLRFI
jgi:hypothetical protein